MSLSRIAIIAAPIGAIGLGIGGLTPYWVLMTIGDMLQTTANGTTSGLVAWATVAFFGGILLSLGMILAAAQSWSTPARKFLLPGAAALFLAPVLVGYANTQLMLAFQSLATAESIDSTTLTSDVEAAFLPTVIGYGILVLGAFAVFAAGLSRPAEIPSQSGRGAALVAATAVALFVCVALAWHLQSVNSFATAVNASATVKPTVLAQCVSGMLISVYLQSFCLAGFGGVALILAITAQPNRDSTPQTSDQSQESAAAP